MSARLRLVLGFPLALNTGSARDLQLLPGIGPARSSAIVEERLAAGDYRDLADLADRVHGIGSATLRALAPHVFVGARDPACAPPLRCPSAGC
ncbi:MAG: competence protein ComE [bacterium]|nr:competence protein ComE [bacterium]